ncbi:MAG: SDR family NAD(P)-dependent oxidoreductase [Thiobacillus sp.]|nr:SDR family NAD(P)-dependent oxidoreductase [Thiobacillus sp.]
MSGRREPSHLIITGASNGIGAALALAYARPGVTLGLIGRDTERLSNVADRCRGLGARVTTGLIDVTDARALHDWILAFDDAQPVDLVIANAGIASTLASQKDSESWDTVRQVFEVNTWGTLNTITPLMDRMRSRRHGQIGIVSSLSAYVGMPISPAYCGSKAAIKVYGEALRGWLAPRGVGVTVICPGFVKSDMSDRFPGPTPFRVSADKAARIIQRGLGRDRARIAFPFPLNLSMWFLSILPPGLSLWLQKRFGFF